MAKEAEVLEAESKVEAPAKVEAPKELTPEEKFKAQYEIKDPGSDGEAAIKKLKEEIAAKQAAKKEKVAAAKAKEKDSGSEEEAATETEEAEGDSPKAKAEAEVVAEPTEDAGDEIPDELWEQAQALGWEEDEIRDFSTVSELKKAVTLAAKAAAKAAPAKAVVEVKQEAKADAEEDDIPDIDPEEYDEKLVKGWKAMKARVKAAEEQNALLAQQHKEREFRELRTRMRGMCDEVKEDYGEINLRKEAEIAGEMDHLLRSGKQFKTEKELFRAAAARVFADQAGANERRKLSRSLNSRTAQTTVRPKGAALKGGSMLKRKIQELKQAGKVDDDGLGDFL